jgi:gluconolactonase
MQIARKFTIIFASILTVLSVVVNAQTQGSVIRLDPALDNIVSPDAKVEKLADSPGPGTREGPLWIRKGGYLLYSDMNQMVINKWDPGTGKVSTFLENTNSNGLTLDRQGRIVFAADGQVVRVEKNGERIVLASEYQGKPFVVPNDLVYKSDGALYFTDPNRGGAERTPYIYLLRGGELKLFTEDMTLPNGLAFTPDEKYLYVVDTMRMNILRFVVQSDDSITNGQLFFDENADNMHPYPGTGVPDGMKVDQKGNVYCTGPSGIWIISPEGKHLGTILVPEPENPGRIRGPSNLAFGGPDGKTLYITGRPGLYRIRLKIPGIHP